MTGEGWRWHRIAREVLVDVAPLRHRDFRLVFTGRAITFLGAMVTFVAVPFQVFQITHSSLAVGLLGLVEAVPLVVAAVIGGAIADARDRRRQVWLTELGLMACSAGLLANASFRHPQVGPIFVLAAIMAALTGLQRPALEAMIPRLVPREELKAGAAVGSLSMTIAALPASNRSATRSALRSATSRPGASRASSASRRRLCRAECSACSVR